MKKTRIFIADDHPVFLKGLKEVLEEEEAFDVVGSAKTGREALEKILETEPDIAILDLDMPVLNGIEIARVILEKKPLTRVVILSMHKEPDVIKMAMAYGIHGYVFKDDAVIELVQAINEVFMGRQYISKADQPASGRWKQHEPEGGMECIGTLTKMERIVLRLIAQNKTSKEIAGEMFISIKTVENHRFNITRKLNLRGPNSLLKFALKNIDFI